MVRRPLTLSLCLFLGIAALGLGQSIQRSLEPPPSVEAAPESPDGDCGPISITQNASLIPSGGSLACVTQDANQYHGDNSWWRAFSLYDYQVDGDLIVCSVDIAIQLAEVPGGGTQPLTVTLYENSGCPFPEGTRTPVATTTVQIANQTLGSLSVPISGRIPAGGELVVQLSVPDGRALMHKFFIGSNGDGETGPSYLSSVLCNLPDPVPVPELGINDFHVIIETIGNDFLFAPVAVAVGPTAVLDPGVATIVAPTWKNQTDGALDVTGTLSNLVAPAGFTGSILDGSADYGVIAPDATANCILATGDCYQVQLDGAAAGHRDAEVTETIAYGPATPAGLAVTRTRELHIGHSFPDVADTSIFYPFIETILHNEITGGCTGGNYCPGDTTLRQQMAVFLLKALEGSCYVPPEAVGVFDDVPVSNPFAPWIEDLAGRGITGGCGTNLYCPTAEVKREQMAVFLLKTRLGSAYTPPAAAHIFSDVPPGDPFEPWIEDLVNRAIAAGCGVGLFCPDNPVNRGQMAPFLTKTFGLLLYAP